METIIAIILILVVINIFYTRRKRHSRLANAHLHFLKGLEKSQQGDFESAIADFDTALQLAPNWTEAKEARDLAIKGVDTLAKLSDSLDDTGLGEATSPGSVTHHFGMGGAMHLQGDHSAALEHLDASIQLNPDYAEAYALRGMVNSSLDRHHAAIEDFDNAIRMIPPMTDNATQRAVLFYQRALEKARIKEYADALPDYDAAIQLNPEKAEAYLHRGLLRLQFLKERDTGMEDLVRAMELAVKDGNAELQKQIETSRILFQ